jgi:hypothetical protein
MEASLFIGESTKNLILQELSNQWPLNLKKIYSIVRHSSKKALSYQAVYKAVKELQEEGILSKQEKKYLISPLWVEKSGEFIDKLAEAYRKNDLTKGKKIQELNFNSLSEAWDFLMSKLNTDFFGESNEAFVQIRRFFIYPLSKEDITRIKEFTSKKKLYIICRANSAIDKMAASFLTSLGAQVITGLECSRPTNILVYGDCVINTFVLKENERAKLTDYYKGTKDMNIAKTNIFKSFGSIFFKKMKVKLIINRDPYVLNDVIEQTKAILSKAPY